MSLTDNIIEQIIEDCGGNFTPEEFGIGRQHGNAEAIRQVVLMRNWCGYPFQITSFWRDAGAHKEGAVDWLLWASWQQSQPAPTELWRLVTTWPWLGVGIYFDWNDGIGLHGDLASNRQRPLRWLRSEGTYFYQSTKDGRFYDPQGNFTTLEEEIEKWNSKAA